MSLSYDESRDLHRIEQPRRVAVVRAVDSQWQQGLKGICAMLNASGKGVLACGVRDDGAIVGVSGDLDALMRSRSQTIAAKFDPAILYQWRVVPHPDGNVLVLQAERAPSEGTFIRRRVFI